jgi:ribosome maturation factor RimP
MTPDPLFDIVLPLVEGAGLELVDLRRTGEAARPVLSIRADRPDATPGHGISTEECARLSRAIEQALESAARVGPRYTLEVSSPGIERPVRFPDHWRRYIGCRVTIHVARTPGRPVAEIIDVPTDDTVVLRLPSGEDATIQLKDIRSATLVYDWPAPQAKKKNRR